MTDLTLSNFADECFTAIDKLYHHLSPQKWLLSKAQLKKLVLYTFSTFPKSNVSMGINLECNEACSTVTNCTAESDFYPSG